MADFRAAPATDDRFLWLHGELDMWSADQLVSATSAAVRAGGAVVVDLTRLRFIDSDGIRALVALARRVGSHGCLILHNPSPHVAKVLDIVGLRSVENVHLLDAHRPEAASSDGPGAWSRLAAFHELRCDVEDRLALAATTARRGEALRSRTSALVTQLRTNRCRSAATTV